MQKVFVLSRTKKQLMPTSPARARVLLTKKRAAVYRMHPFTIILKDRKDGETQPIELKIDPGSKTTGMAMVTNKTVVWAANLNHKGQQIKNALEKRRGIRQSRRSRKTRYRQPRFLNRTRSKGWLPPSLMSRVDNVTTWTRKLLSYVPISEIQVETVRFDMQKMVNPEISGIEYSQGSLLGYELREYLLEKWHRTCAYCGVQNIPLEVEHIQPKSKGGSDRVSNLCLSCRDCNQQKGTQDVKDFLKGKLELLKTILAQAKAPLKDAAAVNVTRKEIGRRLRVFDLPVSFWSGGRTKMNRVKQGYAKIHWHDAACVGESGADVVIPEAIQPLIITAQGRGSRQMCRVDRYGFPRTNPKAQKQVYGFQTGDIVKAIVLKGKKQGTYIGRVAVRTSGSFNVKTVKELVSGISWKCCRVMQRVDGYAYAVNKN